MQAVVPFQQNLSLAATLLKNLLFTNANLILLTKQTDFQFFNQYITNLKGIFKCATAHGINVHLRLQMSKIGKNLLNSGYYNENPQAAWLVVSIHVYCVKPSKSNNRASPKMCYANALKS